MHIKRIDDPKHCSTICRMCRSYYYSCFITILCVMYNDNTYYFKNDSGNSDNNDIVRCCAKYDVQ